MDEAANTSRALISDLKNRTAEMRLTCSLRYLILVEFQVKTHQG